MKINPASIYYFICVSGLVAIGIGTLFSIMHWPFAGGAILTGQLAIAVAYPKYILSKKNRTKLDIIKAILIFLWSVSSVIYVFHWFDGQRYPVIAHVGKIGLYAWIIITLYQYLFKGVFTGSKESIIVNTLYFLGTIILAIGLFMRFMHWPGAAILLMIGIGPATIAILWSVFKEPDSTENE